MKNNNLPRIEHIYIHVPFCLQKCGYCSFYSEILSNEKKQKYLKSLLAEIALFQKKYFFKPKTVYFGGGTPSLLTADEIDSILNKFDLSETQEITLEVNPINISKNYAGEISRTSINRISLGVQSFRDNELKLMGRLHNSEQSEIAFRILRNTGFSKISFDLIYGLPYQTKNDLIDTLEKFLELSPEHISTYCLSLESGVPMFELKSKIPDDDSVAEFYYYICRELQAAGYLQYEISNFAEPGHESNHNLCYWNDIFYLGLGPAAAGYLPDSTDRIRYANPLDVKGYFAQIDKKQILQNKKIITAEEHEKEYIFLTLRKTEGLELSKFKQAFGVDFLKKYELIIEKYQAEELLEIKGDFVRLSPKANFISNEILAEFM